MSEVILNEYNQNTISFSYFNVCLLCFHCWKNMENEYFTLHRFKVPPKDVTIVINDNLRDVLRRVNNSVIYLGNAINGLTNYYNLMSIAKTPNEKLIYENLYRQMCRNTCVELFVYFEKIKALIRYYFDFDFKKTKFDKGFFAELNNITKFHVDIENLKNTFFSIKDESVFIEIMSIRNDEIHNQSKIDDIKYSFLSSSNNGLEVKSEEYFVSNEILYNSIRDVLKLGNKLRNAMQTIIDNINRVDFFDARSNEENNEQIEKVFEN